MSQLAEAIRQGVELPPVTIDDKHNLVVDRDFIAARRLRRAGGLDVDIPVERHSATNEMLSTDAGQQRAGQAALERRSEHRGCTSCARWACPVEAEFQAALSVGEVKLKNARADVRSGREAVPAVLTDPVVLKRDFRHMEGQEMTTSQHIAHAKASGAGVLVRLARQSADPTETINWEHENLKKTLAKPTRSSRQRARPFDVQGSNEQAA